MRTLHTSSEKELGGTLLEFRRQILILSKDDIFSRCLVEAMETRYQDCNVECIAGSEKEIGDIDANGLELVIICEGAGTGLLAMAEFLHRRFPKVSICALMNRLDENAGDLRRLVEKGIVKGVVPMNLRFDIFLATMELLTKGGEHFPAALVGRLKEHGGYDLDKVALNPQQIKSTAAMNVLTTREVEILNLICEGVQNKNIAARLGLSENTVKVHIRNMYKKMRVRNRTEAASMYFNSIQPNAPGIQ